MNIDYKELKEILKLVNEAEITEFNLEVGDFKIGIKKGGVVDVVPVAHAAPTPVAVHLPSATAPAVASVPAAPHKEVADNLIKITSPMVGTFYRAASPDADPFVQVGDQVAHGQTVCIIEAMKLMNDITAEKAGKVVQILVKDGEPVEYGQVLMLLEPLG